jgi:hypothetical protein
VKTSALTSSVVALLLGTSVALAQTPVDEHAGHHPEGATPPPASSAAQPPAQGMGPTAMPGMQDNMKKMQDLMAKIHASKNAAERKQLLQQHSKAMQDQMEMMHSMGGAAGGTMGGGMQMGDGMMKQMMMNHQAMQGRMEMMEMMMGQMLQHQEAQQDAKPAK